MSEFKSKLKASLLLHSLFFLYSWVVIILKAASANEILSFKFAGLFTLAVFILGIYAILWQIVIKRIPLSIAYPQKSVVILWVMLWSWLLWHEEITINNVIGVALVLAGIIIMVKSDE